MVVEREAFNARPGTRHPLIPVKVESLGVPFVVRLNLNPGIDVPRAAVDERAANVRHS